MCAVSRAVSAPDCGQQRCDEARAELEQTSVLAGLSASVSCAATGYAALPATVRVGRNRSCRGVLFGNLALSYGLWLTPDQSRYRQ